MIKEIKAILRDIKSKPGSDLLTYAPWQGPLGIHYTHYAGHCIKWWGYNPIMWLIHYIHARNSHFVKAAFLYVRLGKQRKAVVLDAYIHRY